MGQTQQSHCRCSIKYSPHEIVTPCVFIVINLNWTYNVVISLSFILYFDEQKCCVQKFSYQINKIGLERAITAIKAVVYNGTNPAITLPAHWNLFMPLNFWKTNISRFLLSTKGWQGSQKRRILSTMLQHMGQVMKLWLSCYLILLSIDSKTR